MQSRAIFTLNPDNTLAHREIDPFFQGGRGTPEYHLIAPADWLPSDFVHIVFERLDGATVNPPMDRTNEGWRYTSNGWETQFEGKLKISFMMRRMSQLDPTIEVLSIPTEQTSINIHPAGGFTPLEMPSDAELILDQVNKAIKRGDAAFALTQPPDNSRANNVGIARIEIADDGRLMPIDIKGERGESFDIGLFYPSIALMKADTDNPAIKIGDWAIIQSPQGAADEDNAQLFRMTATAEFRQTKSVGREWVFISDLSGAMGPAPNHRWDGTRLSFENPDGTFGAAVDLIGPPGDTTEADRIAAIAETAALAAQVSAATAQTKAEFAELKAGQAATSATNANEAAQRAADSAAQAAETGGTVVTVGGVAQATFDVSARVTEIVDCKGRTNFSENGIDFYINGYKTPNKIYINVPLQAEWEIQENFVPNFRRVDEMGQEPDKLIGSPQTLIVFGQDRFNLEQMSFMYEAKCITVYRCWNSGQGTYILDGKYEKWYHPDFMGFDSLIPISKGGTGATTAAEARANLGAATKWELLLPASTQLAVGSTFGNNDFVLNMPIGNYTHFEIGVFVGSAQVFTRIKSVVATISPLIVLRTNARYAGISQQVEQYSFNVRVTATGLSFYNPRQLYTDATDSVSSTTIRVGDVWGIRA